MLKLPTEMIDWIFSNNQFDADWYRDTFLDVAILESELKMEPETHYRRYGSLMQRAPNAAMASDPEKMSAMMLPAPKKGSELLEAHKIAMHGAHDRAVHYARRHLPPNLAHTLHVLQANRALAAGDRAAWLGHMNAYLRHFGVAELRLGEGESLMDQFTTDPLPPVTDGPLVSILMPVWNAEKTVGYAVRSILAQTWRNLELLIVDDASEDGTWEIIQQFAASDPRVRVFRNAVNAGPYVSKNVAVSQSKGEWITGHDADDWAHPERVARQVHFCLEHKTPVCMSGTMRMAENGQLVRLNEIGEFVHDGACRSALISLMIDAQFFHDLLGFWDTVRIAGDSELLRRAEKLIDKKVPPLPLMTQFMLDNPSGLTNHPTLGVGETGAASPHRRAYRNSFRIAHKGLNIYNSRFNFTSNSRTFSAPAEILNSEGQVASLVRAYEDQGITVSQHVVADVAIITSLRFPGGNASSSLDEIAFFSEKGLSVAIIHCPMDGTLGKSLSPRYAAWKHIVTNWTRLGRLSTKVLICRNPSAVTSHAFQHIAPRIEAKDTFVVVNNSHLRATGKVVYDRTALVHAAQKIKTDSLTFCPISTIMREELEQHKEMTGQIFNLSSIDWTPTFDLSLYQQAPKAQMKIPYTIGRHGRDHVDKWHEDPAALTKAYPTDDDFRISILGGAKQARKILGNLPDNWNVIEFGEVEPRDYLRQLDVFVYFPNTGLAEAFGRTIVEAMLAGCPVILPRRFELTFDNLPIYANPEQVEGIVRALAYDDVGRLKYLTEVQRIATERYSTPAIARRFSQTNLGLDTSQAQLSSLSIEALRFKQLIERVIGSEPA